MLHHRGAGLPSALPTTVPEARPGRVPAPPGGAPSDPGPVFNWYVDSVAGDDAQSGTAPAQAFATIARLMTVLTPGAKVGLRRGSHWREQLSVAHPQVHIGAYGDPGDPMPLLDCSSVAANASFSLASGQTKTYQISWTHQVDTTGKGQISVWVAGARLAYQPSIADVEANPGSFTVTSPVSASPVTVYVHPPGSTNPTTDGKLYEIAARDFGVIATGAGCVLEDLHTRRNGHNDGSLSLGRDGVARRCLMEDGHVHNTLMGAGSIMEDCVAWKSEEAATSARITSATMYVAYDSGTAAADKPAIFRRCYAFGSNAAPSGGGTIGFYAHTDGTNKWAELRLEGCFARNLVSGSDANNVVLHSLLGCLTDNVTNFCGGPVDERVIDNATMLGLDAATANRQRLVGEGVVVGDILVREARVRTTGVSGAFFWGSANGVLRVESCTFLAVGNGRVVYRTDTHANLRAKDCVYADCDPVWLFSTATGAAGRPQESAGHVYARNGNIRWTTETVTYTSLDDLRAAYPDLEGNSVRLTGTNDPGFAGDPALGDFSLLESSPANQDGRLAGSRMHIERPNWTALVEAWSQGRIGIA